jgi:putative transposase
VAVGADRGVKSLIVAADADGYEYAHWEGVKALRHATDRFRRAHQALSRTKKGSTGRVRAKERVARVHKQVADRRRHIAHQASYDLATTVATLCIEDLGIAGLMKNHRLAKSLADAAMGEAGRCLSYKCAWYGADLRLADRWLASSKTCSGCGHKKDHLELSERTYQCEHCGLDIDRDLNAAVNLARWPALQAQGEAALVPAA